MGMRWSTSFGGDNLNGLLNKTMPHAIKKVQNAAFDQVTLYRWLEKMGGVQDNATGSDLSWPVRMRKNPNFEWRAYDASTPLVANDSHRVASETWAEATGAVVISIKEADLNGGPEQFINYVAEEMDIGAMTMKDKVNVGLHSGSGTWPTCYGLSTIIPETNSSSTIHNISQANYSWWRNQSTASSCSTTDAFGPICLKEVQDMAALASRGYDTVPFRLGVTDDTTFGNMWYYAPTIANQRVMIETSDGLQRLNPDFKTEEPTVFLSGARIIWDHAAPADAMRFFNPGESIKVLFARNNKFRISPQQQSEDSWTYRVLYGVVMQMVNLNPYTTGVLYNFNT